MDTRPSACETRRRRTAGSILLLAGVVVMVVSVALAGTAAAEPKGNNGTIKIDGVPLQGGQANEPHVDCEFAVEFFGYDQGDLSASVTFELQAPTRRASGSQVLLRDTLAIGGDPAGGATDLDASKKYQLDFTGVAPHEQQGYHVKATVHADGSQGADTKHKVFWVQACPAPPTTTTTTTATTSPTTTSAPTTEKTAPVAAGQETTTTTTGVEVLGETIERPAPALPRTGTGVGGQAFLGGFALALAGLVILIAAGPTRSRIRTAS